MGAAYALTQTILASDPLSSDVFYRPMIRGTQYSSSSARTAWMKTYRNTTPCRRSRARVSARAEKLARTGATVSRRCLTRSA